MQQGLASERVKNEGRLADACHRLKSNADFNVFMEYLVEELVTQHDSNDLMRGEDVVRGQGEALRLKKTIKRIDDSGKIMARIRTAEARRIKGTR